MDNTGLTLVNPWDTTEEVKVSTTEMFENFGKFDFSIVDNELVEQNSWLEFNYT